MKHVAEHDLIAYQLQESADAIAISHHLEQCAECAALSESIAETLRVFSAEPVPPVNVDHAWQRMRGSLPVLAVKTPVVRRAGGWWSSRLVWLAPVLVALLCVAVVLMNHRRTQAPQYANNHPGPLTMQPVNADIANHIDSAERLLTEVNHTTGPLDESTLTQAHALMLSNAVYVQQAHAQGDLAQANLLENLGRVLTTLDHDHHEDKGWHIRFEMNTDGLLLDLRILQQNDARQNDAQQKDVK